MPPSTIPSIFNDILSPDPRCENSEPKLLRNGKALLQPRDAWPVLALGAYLLRCRDKAPGRASPTTGVEIFVEADFENARNGARSAVAGCRVLAQNLIVQHPGLNQAAIPAAATRHTACCALRARQG